MPAWVGEYNLDYFNHAERFTHLNCGQDHSTGWGYSQGSWAVYDDQGEGKLRSRMQPSLCPPLCIGCILFPFTLYMHCGHWPGSCWVGSLPSQTAALNLWRRAATPQHWVQSIWSVFCFVLFYSALMVLTMESKAWQFRLVLPG